MTCSDTFVFTPFPVNSYDSHCSKDPMGGAYGSSRSNLDCQVQNSSTTPSDSGAFKTINQTCPVQEATGPPPHQFLYRPVNWDGARVQVPRVSTCPFATSGGKENITYFTLVASMQASKPFDFSAFSRLVTDLGYLNVTDTDDLESSPHSSHCFSFSAQSCSENDNKPVNHYLTLRGTTRHGSCTDRTTPNTSHANRDDTEPKNSNQRKHTKKTRKAIEGCSHEDTKGAVVENEFIARNCPRQTKLHVFSQDIKTAEGSIVNWKAWSGPDTLHCFVSNYIISCHKMSDTARRDFRKRCECLAVGKSGEEEAMPYNKHHIL